MMTDFCPNCGYTIIGTKKKFCGNCGTTISKRPRMSHLKTVGYKTPDGRFVDEPKIGYEAVQKVKANKPGSYSAQSFSFSIISIALIVVSIFVGIGGLFKAVFSPSSFPAVSFELTLTLVILMHSIGVLFGISSRLKSKKAKKFESANNYNSIGRIFASLGILGNLILLLSGLILYGILYDPNVTISF